MSELGHMPKTDRQWLRATMLPIEDDQSQVIEGPPNFSPYPHFDDHESGKTAYWTWIKEESEKKAWTVYLRIADELTFPLDTEYEVDASLMILDEMSRLLVPNKLIELGVRCPAAMLRIHG